MPTDIQDRFDNMTLYRCLSVFLFMALTIPMAKAQDETMTDAQLPTRPLNLSLPRDTVWSSTIRNDVSTPVVQQEEENFPKLWARTVPSDSRIRLPYGSGYEARQRGSGLGNTGTASSTSGYGSGGIGHGR